MSTTSNDDVFALLRKTWQPVALSSELAIGQIQSVTLLDTELIVTRLPQGLMAASDRCPHRGAKFGLGDIHNGHLRCPYHGWEFDLNGACARIPSLADQSHPAVAMTCLPTYPVQERYGMIWVRLDAEEAAALPNIPEYEDTESWTYIVAPPMDFGTGFRREIDNYLDMSHFAFAHSNSLGVAAADIIEDVRISHCQDGLQMDAPFPVLSTPETTPGKLQQAHHRRQRIYLPNFTTIRQTFTDGDERVLVHIPSPISEYRCRVFWGLAISKNFDGPPIEDQIQFAIKVLDEDRIMVENQRPLELPLGAEEGVTVPADRLSVAFKRSFREFIDRGFCQRVDPTQAEDPDRAAVSRIGIVWGSQTGTAEQLASSCQRQLAQHGLRADVLDMSTVHVLDLRDYEQVYIITSTYGKGEAPDNAKAFHHELAHAESGALRDIQFSVCALGDRRYPDFCRCGRDMDQWLEKAGATRAIPRAECDAGDDEPFSQWLQAMLAQQAADPQAS